MSEFPIPDPDSIAQQQGNLPDDSVCEGATCAVDFTDPHEKKNPVTFYDLLIKRSVYIQNSARELREAYATNSDSYNGSALQEASLLKMRPVLEEMKTLRFSQGDPSIAEFRSLWSVLGRLTDTTLDKKNNPSSQVSSMSDRYIRYNLASGMIASYIFQDVPQKDALFDRYLFENDFTNPNKKPLLNDQEIALVTGRCDTHMNVVRQLKPYLKSMFEYPPLKELILETHGEDINLEDLPDDLRLRLSDYASASECSENIKTGTTIVSLFQMDYEDLTQYHP